jgi:Ca-activated chloride channel family protein
VTIQSVGFLVSERAREELECVAEAGGGTYTDAADPEELTAVLGAAFARAFRDYIPQGEPIEGGETRDTAVPISSGEWLDSLSGAGQERWYSIELAAGERLWATATIVRPDTVEGDAGATALSSGAFRTTLGTPTDPEAQFESEGFEPQLNTVGGRGETQTLRSGVVADPDGSSEYAEPGTYTFQVALEPIEDFEAVEFPLEVVIHKLNRLPEAVPVEEEALADATPEPTPTASAQPQKTPDDDGDGGGGTSGVLVGGAGLAVGLVAGGGVALTRRRRAA